MAQEVELKLELQREWVDRFFEIEWFHSHASLDLQATKALENTYIDTPDLLLLRNQSALRIRKYGNEFFQTFKTKGQSIGGLHQRGEWEYPLNRETLDCPIGDILDVSLFPKGIWPSNLEVQSLTPIFETNFTRHCWTWRSPNHSLIEIVLDVGLVVSGDRTANLCEIEMELIEGSPSCMFDLADALCMDLPLVVSDITKAQKGFELFKPGAWPVDLPEVYDHSSVDERFRVAMCVLSRSSDDFDNFFIDTLNGLYKDSLIPECDVFPWLLRGKPSQLSSELRAQWLLKLARHAWLNSQSKASIKE